MKKYTFCYLEIVLLVLCCLSFVANGTENEGFVDDSLCANCHKKIAHQYQTLGMANAFKAATKENVIAKFDLPPFYHQESKRYYQMKLLNDGIYFTRHQLDSKGNIFAEYKRKVDWFLGSGHKSRSYLYQTENGELYLFPIAWYTELQQWGMSPGFDNSHHFGVNRQVVRECLFCHNAYPLSAIDQESWEPHIFSTKLPEGIGCQRCHGPGKTHIELAQNNNSNVTDIWASIINPEKLPKHQQNQVCDQCHLLPSVDFTGIRNPEKNVFSFKAGQDLNQYIFHIDPVDQLITRSDRFEINHHSYRLRQSQCFIKSNEELYCLDCHDPHHKADKNTLNNRVKETCINCHKEIKHSKPINNQQCISCHMQQRRTQDVVNVTMTDHKITLPSPQIKRLAINAELEANISAVEFYMPLNFDANERLVYQAVALIKHEKTDPEYLSVLEQYLFTQKKTNLSLYATLIEGLLDLGKINHAYQIIDKLLPQLPQNPLLNQWLGLILIKEGKQVEAQQLLQRLSQHSSSTPEVHYNLGLSYLIDNKLEEAEAQLRLALKKRDNFTPASFYLAKVLQKLKRNSDAIEQLNEVIKLQPNFDRAYLLLAEIYINLEQPKKAIESLELGQQFVINNQYIIKRLNTLIENQ